MAGSRPSIHEPRRQPATDAERGAEQKADDRGDADQGDRPRQAVADDLRHRRREERERQAEVTVEQLVPVVEVLLPQALVLVQAEQHVQRLDGVGADPALVTRDERAGPGRPGSSAG